jgi:DNA polymerase III subunit delta
MAEPGDIKPAYLIAGSDDGKIDAVLARLRARAEREGGAGALESFGPADGQGAPDAEALVGAIPAMSLIASRRYLVADRVERLDAGRVREIAAALAGLPGEVTVVLVERRQQGARAKPSKARVDASAALAAAVEAEGGEVLRYDAPTARELPARLVADARRLGYRLDPAAARLLIERMGEGTVRLANELERLALWAGPEGEVAVEDLEAMVADTSEEVAWALSDAIVARDVVAALGAAERLTTQGESVTPLVYQAAKRLRDAHRAALALEAGRPQKQVEAELGMHPYAAKMLMRQIRGVPPDELRAATCALADLEWWTRGGSDYPEDVALTLSVRRAAGGD